MWARSSRYLRSGMREIKRACKRCSFKTKLITNEEPLWEQKSRIRLNAEQVRTLLLTDKRVSDLAREWNCNRNTLTKVRRGKSHADVCPEIPRWGADGRSPRRCQTCSHHDGACGFGFPEFEELGPAFASECDLYEESLQPSARDG